MKETLDEPRFGRMHNICMGLRENLTKISVAGQHVWLPSENYFEPWLKENAQFGTLRLLVRRADHSVILPPWSECNNLENLILQHFRLFCFFIHQLSNMMLSESIPKEPLAFEIIRFDNQKNSFIFLVSCHSPLA